MSYFANHIFCCTNQRDAEHPKGCCGEVCGNNIRERFAASLRKYNVSNSRANKSGCLDRCEFGPVVVIYPEGVWYRIADVDNDVDEIVRSHLVEGVIVERLRLPPRS